VRFGEVVDVAPVVGPGFDRGLPADRVAQQRLLAGAGRAQHVEVVAVAADAQAERGRGLGPTLPEGRVEILDLAGVGKGELRGIAALRELRGQELSEIGHGRRPKGWMGRTPGARAAARFILDLASHRLLMPVNKRSRPRRPGAGATRASG
jgi:hypothetical protein